MRRQLANGTPNISIRKTDLWFLPLLEKCLLPTRLSFLLPREVSLISNLLNHLLINALQLHLGARGNNISGIHSSERYTVDFEGAGDEEDALREVLEENDTLAAEAAGEKDEDGTRLEGGAGFGGVDGFANLKK